MAEAVAWREHRLVFRSERLADIAAEFNRYNERQIRIVGDAVKERRFTGTGTATSPESFVQFLAKNNDLTVETDEDEVVIRESGGRPVQ